MAKSKSPKKAKAKKDKVPSWKRDQEKRDKKRIICEAIGKSLAKKPWLLEDLDEQTLVDVIKVAVDLDTLDEIHSAFAKKAQETIQQKLRDAKYEAEQKARQKEWAEKNGAQKLTPKRATAKRAKPIAGATPTPHRADGKSLIPSSASAPHGPLDDDDFLPATSAKPASSAKAASNGDALDAALPGYLEDEALRVAHANGSVTAGDLLKALPEASRGQATGALARLVTRERLVVTGKGRGTKYTLPSGAGGGAAAEASPKNGASARKSKPQLELGEAPLS